MSPKRFASLQFLFRCPFQKEHRKCPLEELKNLAIEERMDYIRKMTFEELKILEFYYNKCIEERKKLHIRKKP